MSILFIDGFDHYSASELTSKWSATPNGAPTLSSTGGRNGNGLVCTSSQYIRKDLSSAHTTTIVGVAFRFPTLSASTHRIIETFNSTTSYLRVELDSQAILVYTSDVSRGYGSEFVSTNNVWNFLEARMVTDSGLTQADITIRINGNVVFDKANLPVPSASGINRVGVGQVSGSSTVHIDDVYIKNDSTFLGDCLVETMFPTADGTTIQFTPLSSTNESNIDETAPDSDTSYNSSSTLDHIDTFALNDLATSSIKNIFCSQNNIWAKKTTTDPRSVASVVRSSGTNYTGTSQTATTSYTYYNQLNETNPNTSVAWTESGLNAAEFGYTVSL